MLKKTLCFILILIQLSLAKEYFQQYVNYKIDAHLNDIENQVEANEYLIYVNHSPDTLNKVYFHLYFNAYQEGAYTSSGSLRKQSLAYIQLDTVKVNGNDITNYDIHKTLMQIDLPEKLIPGDSVRFYFKFISKLPFASTRYGYMGSHYDVGNWFPTPVVYDKEGWHLHQHIDNEFYQEWGDFRVNITVPKGFIVGATGNLINSEIAMQDTTKEVRDWYLHNVEDLTTTTTWEYEAKNVHDFAWTTDPEYKYITGHWNGIDIHYLVMRYNYEYWKKELPAGVESVQFFSETIGKYPYDQITIADTYIKTGGMEYPNIVFINTYIDPVYRLTFLRAVIIHEIAHNWFYGLLGSNQTEYEWQDEGFTQFAEILAMEHIYGRKNNYYETGYDWYDKTFSYQRDERLWSQLSALSLIKSGREEDPVNTMPDKFRYGVYTSMYDKMAAILIMLENTMGDDVFWTGMQNYFKQWSFKHPQPEDFKHVMEKAAGSDLGWFFAQWLNSVRKLDYSLEEYQNLDTVNGHQVTFKIQKLQAIHMPVDILFILEDGDSLLYHIPVDYYRPKSPERKYLAVWHFSQNSYSTTLNVPAKVNEIIIDPGMALLDINRLNNSSRFIPKIDFHFMKNQRFAPPLDAYLWETWPGIFYNDIDNFKIGLANYGSYLNKDHLITLKTWYKIKTSEVDFSLDYSNPVHWLGQTQFMSGLYRMDGRQGANAGLKITKSNKLDFIFDIQNYQLFDDDYLDYPWQKGVVNTVNFNMNYESSQRQSERIVRLQLRNSIAGSKEQFSIARFDFSQTYFSEYSDYAIKLNFSAGTASHSTLVQEKFNLAGANGITEAQDIYYRAPGTFPLAWRRNGHLYKSDFAGVRGISLISKNNINDHILAASIDLNFPNIFSYASLSFLELFDNSLFLDAGSIWYNDFPEVNEFAKSAGVSIAINNFRNFYYIFGLEEIKLDFPLWIDGGSLPDIKKDVSPWLISFEFNLDRNFVF